MVAREACLNAEGLRTARETASGRALDLDFATAASARMPSAYRIAGYFLGDAAEAQDAVQDACIRAWRAWPSLRDRDRFGAWFDQILVNVCRTQLRRRRRVIHAAWDSPDLGTPGVELPEPQASDPFRAALARDAIGRALPALSLELRLVIVLRYWGELTLGEIAERLDIPLGTVKSRHHAALQVLRRRVESAEGSLR